MRKIAATSVFAILIIASIAHAYAAKPLVDEDFQDPRIPWEPRPVTGGQKTLIILVEFSDVRFLSPLSYIQQLVSSVDDFFRRSSYGKMWIEYDILETVITLPRPMAVYGSPEPGNMLGDSEAGLLQYYRDIFTLLRGMSLLRLEDYKHFVVIHAGGDEAISGNPYEIWSHCYCLGPAAEELGDANPIAALIGVEGVWGVSTFSEQEDWAVFAHEFTHSLGISDLYVYGEQGYSARSEVGYWSNMDAGAFLNPPADIDGWNKYILGWIDAITHNKGEAEYVINTLDTNQEPKAIIIPINDEEYYFLHARRKVGQDKALPAEGVLIFKINKMRSFSMEGRLLAELKDANPKTPEECRFLAERNRLCEVLDAPYNTPGKQYTAVTPIGEVYLLVLKEDKFIDNVSGISVTVADVGDGSFKLRISSIGGATEEEEEAKTEETITITSTVYQTVTETLVTTVTTVGTVTKTVVVTYTVKEKEVEIRTVVDYAPLLLVLTGLVMGMAFMGALTRRSRRIPPPPPPYRT